MSYKSKDFLKLSTSLKTAFFSKLFHNNFSQNHQPTSSVKVECLPPEREDVSSNHSRVIPKTSKNGNRYTQLSTKESDIDKTVRWLSSGRMLCEQLPCPNGELNALGPVMQDPH